MLFQSGYKSIRVYKNPLKIFILILAQIWKINASAAQARGNYLIIHSLILISVLYA